MKDFEKECMKIHKEIHSHQTERMLLAAESAVKRNDSVITIEDFQRHATAIEYLQEVLCK